MCTYVFYMHRLSQKYFIVRFLGQWVEFTNTSKPSLWPFILLAFYTDFISGRYKLVFSMLKGLVSHA